MAFIDNEYDAFAGELLHFLFSDMPSPALMLLIFWMEVTMSVSLGSMLASFDWGIGVFHALHVIGIIRKRPVFQQRLRAQFDTVHEEDHLVGIFLRASDELRSLKASHGFCPSQWCAAT